MSAEELAKIIPGAPFDPWCEPLLKYLGASFVHSYDYSDFEGATHLIDLNEETDVRQYDTVIDSGTIEHVFNVAQALKTTAKMCRVGGQILHIAPTNNFFNHGFWQLSPELFFSLYSESNGFSETEVYLADIGERSFWYKLTPPNDGKWSVNCSSRGLFSFVRTTKVEEVEAFTVQQAGYVTEWQGQNGGPPPWLSRKARFRNMLEESPFFPALRWLNRVVRNPDRVLKNNPDMQKVPIRELVSPAPLP